MPVNAHKWACFIRALRTEGYGKPRCGGSQVVSLILAKILKKLALKKYRVKIYLYLLKRRK